ncbi:MAG: hypothetical protein ACE5KI_06035, partial [Dehalococcoidia bacterium]
HVSPHLYMYVADGARVSQDDLVRSAQEFENVIFPSVSSQFGEALGKEGTFSGRLTVLHARIPAVAGYYSPADEYPTLVNPYSNQRRMVYMNVDAAKPATISYYSILAHELQHVTHFNFDRTEEVWVNEGLSAVAEEIAIPRVSWPQFFKDEPDTQLTGWQADPGSSGPHYGAAYLFMKYLAQHYGGLDPRSEMIDLVAEPSDGVQGIDAYLSGKGYDADFDQVFKNWVIANYLDDPEGGIYSYRDIEFRLPTTKRITGYESLSDTVQQYAADYVAVNLKKGAARIVFQGSPSTKLLDNEAHSGSWQWWSNRGDSIDATLTRQLDLTGLQQASLNFWTWYDVEDSFDFVYVEASVNDGATWDILAGRNSTIENPLGVSFGPAYTGISGGGDEPIWVPESIDLSDYAGKDILIRFQYVTDEAVNTPGFAIDDISIPQIGFLDDVEGGDGGWQARGFVRIDNVIPQRFFVQAILFGDEIKVMDVPLTPGLRGEVTVPRFGGEVQEVVLVIAGATPITSEPAKYDVAVIPISED